MPRPPGSRNRDYDDTRRALLDALGTHLLDEAGDPATLKALAAAAGVSVPTLKHYFGDRDGIVRAVLQTVHTESRHHLTAIATGTGDDPGQVLLDLLSDLAHTWNRYGLGRIFASTLALGLEHETLGPTFLDELLEPLLQAVEQLLTTLVEAGHLPPLDPRGTALSVLGPVIVALLHQDNLHGARCRPLDVQQFIGQHVHTIVYGMLSPAGTAQEPA